MRIDKFLKVSRVIKRRTVANTACNGGRVKINGKTAKPSAEIKPGDVVEISFGSGVTRFEVLAVQDTLKKSEVKTLYRILEDT
ncbi:MAG TPA: RNA-binding protein [Clostridiales bacterium]|nr:RNA-binding protein [Clostridiales bacterium]